MSHAILSSPAHHSTGIGAGRLPFRAAIVEAVGQALAAMRARRVVAELSDAQLKDAGIDRAQLFGNRPTIEVPARLMASLMLMR
jgi:uncharacterized protein YjiS (DUF1127 family)